MLTINLTQEEVEYIFNFTMYVVFNPNNGNEHPWMPVFEEQLAKLFESNEYDWQNGYRLMLNQEDAMCMLKDLREEVECRADAVKHDAMNGLIQDNNYRMEQIVIVSRMIYKLRCEL